MSEPQASSGLSLAEGDAISKAESSVDSEINPKSGAKTERDFHN